MLKNLSKSRQSQKLKKKHKKMLVIKKLYKSRNSFLMGVTYSKQNQEAKQLVFLLMW